jgi:hypothetical protein
VYHIINILVILSFKGHSGVNRSQSAWQCGLLIINQILSIHNEFVQTVRDFGHLNKLFGVQFLTLVYGENSDGKEEII